jgi:hypothetical protein
MGELLCHSIFRISVSTRLDPSILDPSILDPSILAAAGYFIALSAKGDIVFP